MGWQDLMSFLLLSYWTVLVAELVSDKSIYTVTSLGMRFPPKWVFCGLATAFMGKMLIAVLFGRVMAGLPQTWTCGLSAATFFGSAVCIWRRRSTQSPAGPEAVPSWLGAVSVSFLTIFLSEWADLGQISAAALVMKYNAAGPIWLGGTLALCSKGALALTLGINLRQRIPARCARGLSVASCLILALISLYPLISSQPRGGSVTAPREVPVPFAYARISMNNSWRI
jgi:putative Ca2+/H+ antiporter (TMEM165/GDT1 family)